ncbi:DEAD/DEAH box helicase [Photobacterium angustum]|uniref:DEAD-box ATP-dependent RNA helicase RhpA n=1 Tax=Photobacterium angustum TaxID=661 RepID=A0A2S7VXN6_PHOAN|nr:DEAD/DEAH box helicase [Photobacterium angustum]PQJ66831.1 DEAD/DEAH box helicase [Photobacterium angustum]
MSFQSLNLHPNLLKALTELGYSTPTDVQQQAIPLALKGDDVMAGAQTGTGKTAAFALPLLQRLMSLPSQTEQVSTAVENNQKSRNKIRALILTPTRELAQQVFDSITTYAKYTELKVAVAYGGTSMNVQVKALNAGAEILVATPGRLLDHVFNGSVSLSEVETFVLDEADRMLDMGFIVDIQRIMKRMPAERQTLFFSATFSKQVKKLAFDILTNPKMVEVTPANTAAETVEQMVYPVDKHRKAELLAYLIGSRNWRQVLVFTKTKQGSDQLAKDLGLDGIKASSINGDKSQGARQRALDDFKSGKTRVLVATDVAARGLDIEQLEYVVNFDMPFKAEDYVHRIGRTGRAGMTGHAITLMSLDEEWALKAIEDLLDSRLPQQWLEGYEPNPALIETQSVHRGAAAEKRRAKSKSKIHQNRGKHRNRR